MSWMCTHKNIVYCLIVGLIVVSVTIFLWNGASLYRQRAAIESEIAGRDYTSVEQPGQETAEQSELDPISRTLFADNVISYEGKRYRRNSSVKAILCIGVDRTGNMEEKTTTGFGGQADGVFLIAQDTARNSIKILMIPRDTMTMIMFTDLSGNELGKDLQHLTMAYAYGDGRELSCQYMTEAVTYLLGGLNVEMYMAADISVIPALNDAAGGVTVTIETDGMEKTDLALKKGETVKLKGKQAERFVRYRDINEDHSALYRMDRQKQYIKGFYEAVQRRSSAEQDMVARMFDLIQEYMVTNMSKDQYLKIALDALENGSLREEDIYTVPGQGVVTPRYDEFYADNKELSKVVLELFFREVQ